MSRKRRVLGVIPARGGSKSIQRKNITPLCGRPLVEYTIDAARTCELLDRLIVSTDSEEIAEVARANGVEVPFLRPAELAGDDCRMQGVMKHALRFLEEEERYVPEYLAILQPTSPLRGARHIDGALRLLLETGADSVVSVTSVPHQFNPHSVMKLEKGRLTSFVPGGERHNLRQHKPECYARNGAIYAFRRRILLEMDSFFGNDCRAYIMDREDSVDIDGPLDLEIAEMMMRRRKHG